MFYRIFSNDFQGLRRIFSNDFSMFYRIFSNDFSMFYRIFSSDFYDFGVRTVHIHQMFWGDLFISTVF